MFSALITAIRTLTIIPVPGHDAKRFENSLPFFPLVGIGIGSLLYITAYSCSFIFGNQTLLAALIINFILVVITGALHLDGLGDVADAFGGGKTKERILEILKDSRHGTFGVSAIVFDLLAKTFLTSIYLENKNLLCLSFSPFFSRTFQAIGCSFFSYARKSGGTAAMFTSNKYRILISVLLLLQTGLAVYISGSVRTVVIILISFLTTLFFFIYCRQRIGGITGDCLGAGNEISEISFLLTGILCCNFLPR
jgi:adenosylcobinamide-GDP ribazoletransferase